MTEATGFEAKMIHRLLEADPQGVQARRHHFSVSFAMNFSKGALFHATSMQSWSPVKDLHWR
jgi:hypothetical protein